MKLSIQEMGQMMNRLQCILERENSKVEDALR